MEKIKFPNDCWNLSQTQNKNFAELTKEKVLQNSELLDTFFDVTSPNLHWLSNEDKEFFRMQVASKGRVGYWTSS